MKILNKNNYAIWLDGVFSQSTISKNKSLSPASNFWKKNLILNLQKTGLKNIILCCPIERAWPLGSLVVNKKRYKSIEKIKSYFLSYLNIPYFREIFKYSILKSNFQKFIIENKKPPKFIITWSVQDPKDKEKAEIKLARYLSKKYKINWLCLLGEGITPPGATHYMYSCWSSYLKCKNPRKYYLDGGIPEFKKNGKDSKSFPKVNKIKTFMYIGDLGIHGGALELANDFNNIKNENIELLICGKGQNKEIEKIASYNPKIKILGYLKEKKLNELAYNAYAFINPRPLNYEPNLLNFPSKLLYYLSFEKPVLSTISPGMSPDIIKAVIPIKHTNINGISKEIKYLLSISQTEYMNICKFIKNYKKNKTWINEVSKFKKWLDK